MVQAVSDVEAAPLDDKIVIDEQRGRGECEVNVQAAFVPAAQVAILAERDEDRALDVFVNQRPSDAFPQKGVESNADVADTVAVAAVPRQQGFEAIAAFAGNIDDATAGKGQAHVARAVNAR
jgi:hypothetical protein